MTIKQLYEAAKEWKMEDLPIQITNSDCTTIRDLSEIRYYHNDGAILICLIDKKGDK